MCCVNIIFFVFKQKTAYEMRISDWSSDVCSSDLSYSVNLLQVRNKLIGVSDVDKGNVDGSRKLTWAEGPSACAHQFGNAVNIKQVRVTIGRASCRERVCQYV